MRFIGKVALVTGAAQGIGRATALRFAREGADIVVADKNLSDAQHVADEIAALGRVALPLRVDVADEHDCEGMVAATLEHFARLDIVFANAGIGGNGDTVADLPTAEWDRVLAVNLRGVFLTCKYAIPALINTGGGAIVTMSSSMAHWDTSSTGAAYMTSKAGISALARSLALQLGGYGIRVNAICPGVIQTRLSVEAGMDEEEWAAGFARFARRIPLRRVGQPDDVAAAVAFLASDDARYITGSELLIDGGQTLQSWSNAPDGDTFPLDGKW